MSGLNRDEVLRYLGYRGQVITDDMNIMLERALAECERLARPRSAWAYVDDPELNRPGAVQTAVFAATVGHELVRAIDRWHYQDMSYALMLDAAATQSVEQLADIVEREIACAARALGLYPCARVSPGYIGIELSAHLPILRALDAARKLGLTASDSLILMPRKSVTAIVGLYGNPQHNPGKCETCARRNDCRYRKDEPGGHIIEN